MSLQVPTANDRQQVRKTLTILRPREELFAFWLDLRHLPRFMEQVRSVTVDGELSHWVVKGPGGTDVHWDAGRVPDLPRQGGGLRQGGGEAELGSIWRFPGYGMERIGFSF